MTLRGIGVSGLLYSWSTIVSNAQSQAQARDPGLSSNAKKQQSWDRTETRRPAGSGEEWWLMLVVSWCRGAVVLEKTVGFEAECAALYGSAECMRLNKRTYCR